MTRPIIVLTRVAYDVVRANARPDARFVDTARARPDGDFDVPVAPEVKARLESARLPGETHSDTLLRLAAHRAGRVN